jgi:hypothetical protein
MQTRRFLALCGATIAVSLTLAANAFAASTAVTVRVEGKSRTLLPTTVVHTHTGSITKAGAPPGTCPATSAAGALDVATHGRWNGSYSTQYHELSVTSILGETWSFSQIKYYWGIWVDNRYAPAGICELKLHKGEQLLFAAVPDKGTEYPIVLKSPRRATTGHQFNVKAVYVNGKGVAKPLAGVSVKGAGAVTNGQGIVTITPEQAGKLVLSASRSGYIRSAQDTVRVSS